MDTTPHYLYVLQNGADQVVYVGITSDPCERVKRHLKYPDTKAMYGVTGIANAKIVAVLQGKEEGHRVEREYIQAVRARSPLLNKTREWPIDDPRRGRSKTPSSTRAESVRVSWIQRRLAYGPNGRNERG